MKRISLPEELQILIQNKRVPHALFIEGSTDKNRVNCAYAFAAEMMEGAYEKVMSKNHPDVILVEKLKDKKSINAEQVRNMRADAYIMPNEADNKIYILRDADEMSVTVQNIILKLLEEPPEGVILILTGTSRSKLLPTVRSRLTVISLSSAEADSANEKALRLLSYLSQKDSYEVMAALTPAIKDRVRGAATLKDTKALLLKALKLKSADDSEKTEEEVAIASRSLAKKEILSLCDLLSETESRLTSNANQGLLSAWFGSKVDRIFSE